MQDLNLLHIEDNGGDILLTREALEEICPDVKFHEAANGLEGIDFLKNCLDHHHSLPQIILLDINLPKMNGFDVLHWVKSHPQIKNTPVIILSTSSNPKDIQKAYDLHANAFIIKPLEIIEFQNTIESFIQFWIRTVQLPGKKTKTK